MFSIVKDLLSKLLCPKEKRLNVYEAMNHAFFKKYCKSNEDQSNLEEGEYTSRQIHTPFLNIQNLNKFFLYFFIYSLLNLLKPKKFDK